MHALKSYNTAYSAPLILHMLYQSVPYCSCEACRFWCFICCGLVYRSFVSDVCDQAAVPLAYPDPLPVGREHH